MEPTECSETSAYNILDAGEIPMRENIPSGKFVAKKINGREFETIDVLVKCWG
jgi:hypothetical protein